MTSEIARAIRGGQVPPARMIAITSASCPAPISSTTTPSRRENRPATCRRAAVGVEPVVAAVEREQRIVIAARRAQARDLPLRNIGRIGEDQVEPPGQRRWPSRRPDDRRAPADAVADGIGAGRAAGVLRSIDADALGAAGIRSAGR